MLSMLTLKSYLQQRQRVSLTQLASVFNEDSAVIEGMLSHFIQKGQLRQCCYDRSACKGCTLKCVKQPVSIFEWVAVC